MPLPAVLGLPLGATVMGLFGLASSLPGAGDLLSQTLNNLFQAKIQDVTTLVEQRRKGQITKEQYETTLGYWGYKKAIANQIYDSVQSGVTPTEALRLYFQSLAEKDKIETGIDLDKKKAENRKGVEERNPFNITKEWLAKQLEANGLNPAFVEMFIQANRPTPSFDDIARFAARDVFEPEQVKLGRLNEGLTEDILDQFRKTGASDQLSSYVWFAHWLIPSLNQFIEFRQRLFDHPDPEVRFTDKEMDTAFKLADLAPGFRKRIRAITFTPLGRVDIRRADSLGQFGEGNERRKRLIREYQEIGFDQKNSEFQADFTIKLNTRDSRELSKTEILKFYREGVFGDDRDTVATDLLKQAGYGDEEIKFLLEYERMVEIDQDEKQAIESLLSDWLRNKIKTEADLRTKLAALDLTRTQIQKEITRFNRARIQEQKRMDNTEAEKLVRLGVLDLKQYAEILEANGLVSADIEALQEQFDTVAGSDKVTPGTKDVIEWFSNGVIIDTEFISLMRENGHTDLNIKRYALNAGIPLGEAALESLKLPKE